MEILLILLIIALVTLVIYFTNRIKEFERKLEKYSPISSIDDEIDKSQKVLESLKQNYEKLSNQYKASLDIYKSLEDEIKLFKDDLELKEFGVYEPHFSFDTASDYKDAMLKNNDVQKQMIRDEKAALCHTAWTVGNSRKQGEIMTRKGIKLALRAFNGESDALIAKVKWNNIEQSEKRIQKSFDAINKLNESNHIYITDKFLDLKIEELRLAYEYERKKYEEKEEQRIIKEQIREEEKINKELEKAQKDAEEEERRYQIALEKVKKELEESQGGEIELLQKEVEDLQRKLDKAHEYKERAISRAQQTKSGYVYVLSNIGSFGETTYKIGMTRRLDPMDRVKELGDASVPFPFDVHGMIYSDNAPEMENKLHRFFHNKRVNMINLRKEYFKVSIHEIEQAVISETGKKLELTKLAEAQEYRETLAVLAKNMERKEEKTNFPDALIRLT